MATKMESQISKLRRQCNLAIFIQHFSGGLWVALGICGLAILLTRLFFPGESIYIYASIFGGVAYIVYTSWHSRKHFIGTKDAVNMVDLHMGAQGALITCHETKSDQLSNTLDKLVSEKAFTPPRWRPWPLLEKVLPCLLFFLATLFVPARYLPAQTNPDPGAQMVVEKLTKEINELKKQDLISELEESELDKALENFKKKINEKKMTQADWEALDEIQKRLQESVKQTKKDLAEAREKTEDLEKELGEAGSDLNELEKKIDSLQKSLDKLAKKNPKNKDLLQKKEKLKKLKELLRKKKKMEKLLKKKDLTQKELQRMIEQLKKKLNEKEKKELEKLAKEMEKQYQGKKKPELTPKQKRQLEELMKKLSPKEKKELKKHLQKPKVSQKEIEKMLKKLQKKLSKEDIKKLTKLARAMAKQMKGQKSPKLTPAQKRRLEELMKKMGSKEAKKTLDELKKKLQKMQKKSQSLAKKGQGKSGLSKHFKKLKYHKAKGQKTPQAKKCSHCKGSGKGKSGAKCNKCNGTGAGKGGVSRGGSSSPIVYGDESLLKKKKFNPIKLKTNMTAKDLEKLRESKGDPTKGKRPEKAVQGKKRNFGNSSGTNVWKRGLSLSRRKAIKEYFSDK